MKVKTNLRAGKQTRSGTDNTKIESVDSVEVYYPPVTRCVGI